MAAQSGVVCESLPVVRDFEVAVARAAAASVTLGGTGSRWIRFRPRRSIEPVAYVIGVALRGVRSPTTRPALLAACASCGSAPGHRAVPGPSTLNHLLRAWLLGLVVRVGELVLVAQTICIEPEIGDSPVWGGRLPVSRSPMRHCSG